jgi:hypothetical protein
MQNQMYFMGEKDFANTVWEYMYSPDAVIGSAIEITQRVAGLIPAEASLMAVSEAQEQIFILTDALPNRIYVNKARVEGQKKVMNAWYYWEFSNEVLSMSTIDEYLYMLTRRGSRIFIERVVLGLPEQDTDGSPAQTLSYALRIDRKLKIQGVYDSDTNITTWTVPVADSSIDEVVLAATWDTDDVKLAGSRLTGFTVQTASNDTVITIEGDYENNGDGEDAPVYIGRSYRAFADISQQFVRTQEGAPLYGNMSILKGKVRHKDAATYAVEITPPGRATLRKEFVVPSIGSTPLDSVQLQAFGEFPFRVIAPSEGTRIRLVNDSPFPAVWVDLDFRVQWNPGSYSSIRK